MSALAMFPVGCWLIDKVVKRVKEKRDEWRKIRDGNEEWWGDESD